MNGALALAWLAFAGPVAAGPIDRCVTAIPEGRAYDFLRIASASAPDASRVERVSGLLSGLDGACGELDPQGANAEFLQSRRAPELPDLRRAGAREWTAYGGEAAAQFLYGTLDAGALIYMPLAASLAQASDLVIRQGDPDGFVSAIDAHRQIADPYERARRIYALVARRQGPYNDAVATAEGTFARPVPLAPSALRARGRGDTGAGVCRDFALLLYWALQRAERPARDAVRPAGFAGPLTYEVAMVSRFSRNDDMPLDTSGHVWVRIAFPRAGGGHAYADLDTTWHDSYAPLAPRFSRLSENEQAEQLRACRALRACATEVYRPTPLLRKIRPVAGPGGPWLRLP